jgi:hypothetical protein
MHWILHEGFHSEFTASSLISSLTRFQIPFSIHRVTPKIGDLIPEAEINHKNVICIGSYSMRHVASKNNWKPGIFDLFDQNFEQQRFHWSAHMLNFNSKVSQLSEAKFEEEKMFVRPVHDSKSFTGKVFSRDEFIAWSKKNQNNYESSLNGKTLIQISPLVNIFAEYRFCVIKGLITTQSLYKRGGHIIYQSDVDQVFVDFVADRIQEWQPHEAFVIDVCDTDSGIKIVEINTLNSSAFYAADVDKLVIALEEAFNI